MMLSLDTAYRSFGGEVEASSTPTICRLPDSRRHQLWAIAQPTAEERGAGNPHATFCGSRGRATASGDPVGEEKSSSLPRPLQSLGWSNCLFRPRPHEVSFVGLSNILVSGVSVLEVRIVFGRSEVDPGPGTR